MISQDLMKQSEAIKIFDGRKVRTLWDSDLEKWFFSIVDTIAVLTDSVDPGAYWRKLKEHLLKEGNETVTNCHSLKMKAIDGKMRKTDVADTEQLFRLIQSVPSPKAEPFAMCLESDREFALKLAFRSIAKSHLIQKARIDEF